VLREIDFLLKNFPLWIQTPTFVETSHFNTDMCETESSQSHESRAQPADSSKLCSKPERLNSDIIYKQQKRIV